MLQKIFILFLFFILSVLALSTWLMTLFVNSSYKKRLLAQLQSHLWEYIAAVAQVFILASSMFSDSLASAFPNGENHACSRVFITNSSDAATFLSIYSTIFAVNVALWALFSGAMDKSYMGISYVEYFFSMKPRIYKQKWVVLVSLVILLTSCVCYLCGFYDFVGASLVFEIISIGASTMFLYGIFRDPKQIKDEIRRYSIKKQFEAEQTTPPSLNALEELLMSEDDDNGEGSEDSEEGRNLEEGEGKQP